MACFSPVTRNSSIEISPSWTILGKSLDRGNIYLADATVVAANYASVVLTATLTVAVSHVVVT